MAKRTATALLFTVIGLGLAACVEEPQAGSHSPGYKGTSSGPNPQEDQRPYDPAHPSTY
jgi:hypothetical protein